MHYRRWRIHGDVGRGKVVPPDCKKCGAAKRRNDEGKIFCPACAAESGRIYRERNADRLRIQKQARYLKNRDRILAHNKANYEANRETYAAATKAWQQANRARVLGYKRKWSSSNPDKGREYAHKRRAMYLDAACEHGADCVSGALHLSIRGLACIYCGAAAEHADHYIPLSRGGLHCKDNIVPACKSCNLSKNNQMPDEWLAKAMPA